MVKHQIYEVRQGEIYNGGVKYFAVYYQDGRTGLRYVYPSIAARDEIEAYTIAMKKLEEGAEQ